MDWERPPEYGGNGNTSRGWGRGGTGALSIISLGGAAAHESQCPEVYERVCKNSHLHLRARDSCVLCIHLQAYSSN